MTIQNELPGYGGIQLQIYTGHHLTTQLKYRILLQSHHLWYWTATKLYWWCQWDNKYSRLMPTIARYILIILFASKKQFYTWQAHISLIASIRNIINIGITYKTSTIKVQYCSFLLCLLNPMICWWKKIKQASI